MTWLNYLEWLAVAQSKLPPLSWAEVKQVERMICQRESWQVMEYLQANDQEAQDTLQTYLLLDCWPALDASADAQTLVQLRWRFDLARDALEILRTAERQLGLTGKDLDKRAVLEWLLIDGWDAHGREATVRRLEVLRHDTKPPSDTRRTAPPGG